MGFFVLKTDIFREWSLEAFICTFIISEKLFVMFNRDQYFLCYNGIAYPHLTVESMANSIDQLINYRCHERLNQRIDKLILFIEKSENRRLNVFIASVLKKISMRVFKQSDNQQTMQITQRQNDESVIEK